MALTALNESWLWDVYEIKFINGKMGHGNRLHIAMSWSGLICRPFNHFFYMNGNPGNVAGSSEHNSLETNMKNRLNKNCHSIITP